MINNLVVFHFCDCDGNGCEVYIYVLIHSNFDKYEIEDAISSYIDYIEDWQFEELVTDVLNSFNLNYEIVNPIMFNI